MNQRLIALSACVLLLFSFLFEPILRLQTIFRNNSDQTVAVVIDPGHGGIDGGAIGLNGTIEKGINLEISKRIFDLFGLFGIHSVLTRDTDVLLGDAEETIRHQKNADLRERVRFANEMKDACLLSVHLNSFPDSSCHGAQVFFSPVESSESLAKSIQGLFKQGIDQKNKRVAKPAERGHYLLNHTQIPSVIIECGFLSNRDDEVNLVDSEYQKRIAACIVQGYRNYQN